jgi:hypothetical protein
MNEEFNPYAPPAARLENPRQVGAVWREGKLVAMEHDGQLPPRCVRCNSSAEPKRLARTLYWTPPAWRWSLLAVFVFLLVMIFSGSQLAALAFWPAAIVAVIANWFVRKKVAVDFPLCARHQRIGTVLTWAAVGSLAACVGLSLWTIENAQIAFVGMLVLMLVLGTVRARTGAHAVGLARLEGSRAWLKGIGASFRESLPERAPADRAT